MIVLRSAALEAEVLPEVGGKVGRLLHRGSGRQLLVEPRRPHQTIPHDRQWTEYDTSGIDDCFPNVDEGPYPVGPWASDQMVQLGDWVRGMWTVVATDDHSVEMERSGTVLPYVACKRVSLSEERTLRFDYAVTNTGRDAFPYIWSAHPLLAVGDTFELRLPGSDLEVVKYPHDGERWIWPLHHGVDLSRAWIPRARTLKTFVTGLTARTCELMTGDRRLLFAWECDGAPVLGVWFNNYGFSGGGDEAFRCIAVEPCTSPTDVLHALPASAYPCVEAGETPRWWWSLTVD